MKEAFDKEIDSLLRRHVGAGAGARSRGDGERADASPTHLDADELSAFAEGSLPTPARLAAVSHLADCDECRAHVVSLSRAAGMEGELEKRAASAQVETAKPARWREWLSALFAPRVLRYAAPALALCLVAAVSFIALRSRREGSQLAQRASSTAARRTEAARTDENGGLDTQTSSNANASTANSNVSVSTSEEPGEETEAHAPGGASRPTSSAKGPNAEGEASAGATDDAKRAEATPPPAAAGNGPATAAPAPKAAAQEPAEVAKTENKEKKDERQAANPEDVAVANEQPQQPKQRAQQRSLEPVAPDDSRSQNRSAANNAQSGLSNNGSRAGSLASTQGEDRDKAERGGGRGATPSRRGRSDAESRAQVDEDEVVRTEETRTAAGHRFRRERGTWVDVNYKPSMPSTGVRRGTDAYSALVADIPEVGRVAEQLGGEVFVVVHGHAYHIR